jgi:hypothetical protein
MSHNINNDKNTTTMFIRLNKTTQKKTWTPQEKTSAGKNKELCSKKMYFSVNYENEIALKYFDLKSSAAWRFRKENICLRMGK